MDTSPEQSGPGASGGTRASTRRTVLTTGLTAVGAAFLVASPGTTDAVPALRPARADRLVDAFGICIHLNFRSSVYGDHERVIDWVDRLGARHVRTRLSPAADVLDSFRALAERGISVQARCGEFGDDQSMAELMSAVRRHLPQPERVLSAFEGLNEPNNNDVAWIAETRQRTEELHEARREFGLDRIPIVAPSLARVTSGGVEGDTTLEQARNLGSLRPWVDHGNMHIYPQGRPPSEDVGHFTRCARLVSGTQRVMCTEGGYFTAMGYHGNANPVPPQVAAAYAPQAILEHWRLGTTRFFRYELLDEPDAGPTDREGTLGTVDTSGDPWRPKPDFEPVRRLLEVFADPGDQSFRVRPLRMALRQAPPDLRYATFVNRDGTHLVALWLDRHLYHPIKRRMLVDDLRQPLDTVRLVLDRRRNVAVEHLVEPGRRRRLGRVAERRIPLPAGVTVLTLR